MKLHVILLLSDSEYKVKHRCLFKRKGLEFTFMCVMILAPREISRQERFRMEKKSKEENGLEKNVLDHHGLSWNSWFL